MGIALFVGGNGLQRVLLVHVYIADGIIHLVKVVLVVVGCRHAFQSSDHLLGLSAGHHLGHGNAGIELQFVRWVQSDDMLVGLICLFLVPQGGFHLSHQKPLAGFLLAAHLMANHLAQIGDGLFIALGVDVIVGIGIIPFFLRTPVHRVAAHLGDDVFGIIHPVLLDVAFGQPRSCPAVDGRLCGIHAAHVGKGGGGLVECALHELRASHEHPCFPQERVVFLAVEPFHVTLSLLPVFRPFGSPLDAVQFDGLLAFFYCHIVFGLAQFLAGFVAHRIEGNHLGEIVLVARLFFQRAVNISQRTIIIGIILRIERMPPAALRSILFCRASCRKQQHCHGNKGDDMSFIQDIHVSKLGAIRR